MAQWTEVDGKTSQGPDSSLVPCFPIRGTRSTSLGTHGKRLGPEVSVSGPPFSGYKHNRGPGLPPSLAVSHPGPFQPSRTSSRPGRSGPRDKAVDDGVMDSGCVLYSCTRPALVVVVEFVLPESVSAGVGPGLCRGSPQTSAGGERDGKWYSGHPRSVPSSCGPSPLPLFCLVCTRGLGALEHPVLLCTKLSPHSVVTNSSFSLQGL